MGLRRRSPVEPHGAALLSVCITALGKEVDSEVPRFRGDQIPGSTCAGLLRAFILSSEVGKCQIKLDGDKSNKMHLKRES